MRDPGSSFFEMEQNDLAFCELAARFWHPVARSVDVVPGAVVGARLLTRDLAVFRAGDGRVSVLDDLCAHRGARLSAGAVDRECLRCPYHSWSYAADGQCVDIPQLAPEHAIPGHARVEAFRVSEHAGLIWTCLVDEARELRPRPTWPVTDAGTHWLHVGAVYDWQAQAFRQIENFCDVAHFSILHADTFGNDEQLQMEPIQVDASDGGYRLAFDYSYPSRDPTVTPAPGAKRPIVGTNFEYRLELPFTVALANASGPDSVMCIAASPVSATAMRLFWLCAFPLGVDVDADAYEELESRIWLPDRAIVEGQRPERLPLDLLEELHLPFDRLAIAYRRALRAIGFTIPTGATPTGATPTGTTMTDAGHD
jgi:phenylpropionate dioxygenase-like ring-hydroxylating dioxygenase large terminal subunit